MSRWLQRLSSSSSRKSLDESNGSKQKVQAHNNHDKQKYISPGYPTAAASWTLLRLNKALHEREEELSDRSYQLLVQKLRLCEDETILAQQYEDLTREKPSSATAMEQLRAELQSLSERCQEIQATKARLVEQHERLEAAIEAIAADKERLAEEYHMQFSVQ